MADPGRSPRRPALQQPSTTGGMQEGGPINLAVLHAWLVSEHGYSGSLRSIQRYWARTYPAPRAHASNVDNPIPGSGTFIGKLKTQLSPA